MWTRRALAGLAAAGALSPVAGRANVAASRAPEVAALRAFAEQTHPRGREAAADPAWRATWDRLALDADGLGDGAYFAGIRTGLAWFRDGHTTLLPFAFVGGPPPAFAAGPYGRALPWRVQVFHDGLYVTEARDEAASLLGARVTSVDGAAVPDILRRQAKDWPGSAAWAQRWAGGLFDSAGGLGEVGLGAGGVVAVTAEGADGRRLAATLRPRPGAGEGRVKLQRTPTPQETWAAEARTANSVRLLPETVYVAIDEMANLDGKPFPALTREVFAAMGRPDAKRVVIDLRRNGGGDNFLGESLRKGIERSRFNRPGGLYVLTSPRTFSAAQNLANRLERETFALFVGEPTGGSPNHYGDGKTWQGPVTGVTALVSTLPWFDSFPMDKRPWIAPDLPVPSLFADWKTGRDAALDLAIAHLAEAADDDLSMARIYYFQRPSQRTDWTPFWR